MSASLINERFRNTSFHSALAGRKSIGLIHIVVDRKS